MKYLVYLRKSTEDTSHQVQSLDTQKRILLEFASKNPDIEIVDIITESRSAKDDGNRPKFDDMLKRFKKGEAEGLLVAHIDRISRNLIESGLIQKLNDQGIIKQIRTPERIYSNYNDFFLLTIELATATLYPRNLSKRVKEGMISKAQKGEYVCGVGPIGYINNHGTLIQDLSRAKYIKEIFKMYSSGKYSLKQISNILYTNGFRTRANKKVCKSKIHQILKNPIYYGVTTFDGIQYKGNFKPIISKSVFDLAQEVLTGKNRAKKYHHEFRYREFLFCDKCGCKITATIKKGKFKYYYCTNGKGICEEHKKYLNEKTIEKIFQEFFRKFQIDPELATISLNKYIADKQASKTDKKFYEETLKKDLIKNEKKLDRLEELYMENLIEKDRYIKNRNKLLNENILIKENLKTINNHSSTLEPIIKLKNELITLENTFVKNDDIGKSNLIRSVLWNCTIFKDNIQKINLKKPYSLFNGMQKCHDLTTWLLRMDSNHN